MGNQLILIIIALGGINFSMRFFPALILNKMELPEIVKDWLSFVPVATIGALLMPMLMEWDGELFKFAFANKNLLAAIPAVIIAKSTNSLGLTLAAGMGAMALLQII